MAIATKYDILQHISCVVLGGKSTSERLVFEVADGVTTPEEGRELVSMAARLISLSPDYSIRRTFDFE